MRRLVVLLFLITFINVISAQVSISVDFGASYNHNTFDISNKSFMLKKDKTGFTGTLNFNYTFNDIVKANTGLGLIKKNYSIVRTNKYEGIYENFNNTYIQIPLSIQIRLKKIKKTEFFFSSGIFGSYWVYGKEKGYTPNIFNSTSVYENGEIIQYLSKTYFSNKYQFSKKDNRYEFGFLLGVNINYFLKNKYSIFLNISYYQSLTDQQKDYMLFQKPKTNSTICSSLGLLIPLQNNCKE